MRPLFYLFVKGAMLAILCLSVSGCGNSQETNEDGSKKQSLRTAAEAAPPAPKENRNASYKNELRQIAWDSLAEQVKTTVKGNWKRAVVEKVDPGDYSSPIMVTEQPISDSADVYKVTFRTTADEMLFPIGIYIDLTTKQIVGRDARE
ncbi:hypothetical protein ACFPYJ_16355 [Paenibacillus solisilvae]|uniref:Lipoprotein n=1 Tax=Paenibacillus solisilvae TaxID=2486751 RepID=A0ABW0VXS8_9BACL